MTGRLLPLSVLAVASLALGAAAVGADRPGRLSTHEINPYWSGYVVTGTGRTPISYTA